MTVKPWQRPTGEGLLDVDKEVDVLEYGTSQVGKWWYLFLPREVHFRPHFTSFAFLCNFFNWSGVNQVVLETAHLV